MEDYEIIGWPEIQDFMDIEGFDDNAALIEENNAMGIGGSTYLVSKDWLDSLNEDISAKSKGVIDMYVKYQTENNMRTPRYADVYIYWEDESPDDLHSATIALSKYDANIDDDDAILFYTNSVEDLIELMKKDNGTDFVVTDVISFY